MGLLQLFTNAVKSGIQNSPYLQSLSNGLVNANNVYSDSQAIWDREDSAYQRMVEDMKKAGLNPWTGVSTGGLATSGVNPSESKLNALMTTFSNYNDFANMAKNWFSAGSQLGKNISDSATKMINSITNLAKASAV